jgi:endonuclease YncB( thermonuclease family)
MRHYKRRRRIRSLVIPLVTLGGGALAGLLIGGASNLSPAIITPGYSESVTGCSVTDGDTISCQGERIRLLAIDAPEMPGHCRSGRQCAPGDPFASTRSLGTAMTGPLKIERFGEDHYGRTLAAVAGSGGDLSCHQLLSGHAIYRADWDDAMRIARTCPRALIQ